MMIMLEHILPVRQHKIRNKLGQKGQAVIELSLMMTFLAMILLALVIIHELGYKNIVEIEKLRYKMRGSMMRNAPGPFKYNFVKGDVFVDLPGRMKEVFGAPSLSQPHKIEFYEGSYWYPGNSEYRQKWRIREIRIQD